MAYPSTVICLKCSIEMKPLVTGVLVIEMAGHPPAPYLVWNADAKECPACGLQIVTGFGSNPILGSYSPNFDEELAKRKVGKVVIEWHERTPIKWQPIPTGSRDKLYTMQEFVTLCQQGKLSKYGYATMSDGKQMAMNVVVVRLYDVLETPFNPRPEFTHVLWTES